ncbi:4c36d070-9b61-48cb-9b51-c436a3670ace [Thermothielavioides terrestris]|uniref:4c36d070-9b61-48cb-9b51-c436a3670ace n=1 Tax=Thermothielavioides terrestris TaxID=2587410 RepID=A0A3S4AN38_9PEZI|nr:4c36d070-9b61-48cb-9b51-c436a3670ace [Thermothielavioides terrestris]
MNATTTTTTTTTGSGNDDIGVRILGRVVVVRTLQAGLAPAALADLAGATARDADDEQGEGQAEEHGGAEDDAEERGEGVLGAAAAAGCGGGW